MQLNYKLAIEAWAPVKKQQWADGSEMKQQKMLMTYQQAFEGQAEAKKIQSELISQLGAKCITEPQADFGGLGVV